VEDTVKENNTVVKENSTHKKLLTQNIQKIQDKMIRPNLKMTWIEENEDSQLKGPENVFNKIIEENFPNLNIEIQEVCRTPNK